MGTVVHKIEGMQTEFLGKIRACLNSADAISTTV